MMISSSIRTRVWGRAQRPRFKPLLPDARMDRAKVKYDVAVSIGPLTGPGRSRHFAGRLQYRGLVTDKVSTGRLSRPSSCTRNRVDHYRLRHRLMDQLSLARWQVVRFVAHQTSVWS